MPFKSKTGKNKLCCFKVSLTFESLEPEQWTRVDFGQEKGAEALVTLSMVTLSNFIQQAWGRAAGSWFQSLMPHLINILTSNVVYPLYIITEQFICVSFILEMHFLNAWSQCVLRNWNCAAHKHNLNTRSKFEMSEPEHQECMLPGNKNGCHGYLGWWGTVIRISFYSIVSFPSLLRQIPTNLVI